MALSDALAGVAVGATGAGVAAGASGAGKRVGIGVAVGAAAVAGVAAGAPGAGKRVGIGVAVGVAAVAGWTAGADTTVATGADVAAGVDSSPHATAVAAIATHTTPMTTARSHACDIRECAYWQFFSCSKQKPRWDVHLRPGASRSLRPNAHTGGSAVGTCLVLQGFHSFCPGNRLIRLP